MYLKVGQFKDPTNLESATDDSYMLFTEKSPNFNLFFNSGYEMGLALVGRFDHFDGVLGLVQGAPNLPRRYLPEQLQLPLPMLLRVGYSNGISDDPFHPRQTGFIKSMTSNTLFTSTVSSLPTATPAMGISSARWEAEWGSFSTTRITMGTFFFHRFSTHIWASQRDAENL